MPRPIPSSPPLVPGFDLSVFIVLDDFGSAGRAYRETSEAEADREAVVRDMLEGQYEKPVRVVEFNTAEGWSRDVSEDIAREVADRATAGNLQLLHGTRMFLESELGDRTAAAD